MKIVPVLQATSLLSLLTVSDKKHVTSTTVPRSTGNCAAVSIVVVQSVFSPVQNTGAEMEGLWELLFGAATLVLIN